MGMMTLLIYFAGTNVICPIEGLRHYQQIRGNCCLDLALKASLMPMASAGINRYAEAVPR